MRVAYCGANNAKQLEPLLHGQAMFVDILRDRFAVHVVHDEVRQPIVGRAGIQEPSNIGMVEPRQDFAFALETPQDFVGIGATLQHFDRDLLLKGTVCALGEVDCAHSAAAQLTNDRVGAHALPRRQDRHLPVKRLRRILGKAFE